MTDSKHQPATVPSGEDVVARIKQAEDEAAAIVAAAEARRRQMVADAETTAAKEAESLKVTLQSDHQSALSRAREDAANLLRLAADEARAKAEQLEAVPEELFASAVKRAVIEIKQRWQ